jgi:hypothetical protein
MRVGFLIFSFLWYHELGIANPGREMLRRIEVEAPCSRELYVRYRKEGSEQSACGGIGSNGAPEEERSG